MLYDRNKSRIITFLITSADLTILDQLEVIPAQSAYPYRLIGSLSLPIRLCVRLSPSSPLPLTLPSHCSGLRRGLRISISPLCPSLSLLSPPPHSTSPAIPSFPLSPPPPPPPTL